MHKTNKAAVKHFKKLLAGSWRHFVLPGKQEGGEVTGA